MSRMSHSLNIKNFKISRASRNLNIKSFKISRASYNLNTKRFEMSRAFRSLNTKVSRYWERLAVSTSKKIIIRAIHLPRSIVLKSPYKLSLKYLILESSNPRLVTPACSLPITLWRTPRPVTLGRRQST